MFRIHENPKNTILSPHDRPDDKDYCEKNTNAFAELIHFTYDRIMSLIMRKNPDNGKKYHGKFEKNTTYQNKSQN